MCTAAKTHPFQAAGFGVAPYRMVGYSVKQGPIMREDGTQIGYVGQPMGTCEFCGMGIAHCFEIASADGVRFIVGADCAEKVDPAYKNEARSFRRTAEERKASQDRRAQQEAELARQREANGGLTDSELRVRQEEEAKAARQAKLEAMKSRLAEAFPVGKRMEFKVKLVFSTSGLGHYGTWYLSKFEVVGGEFDGLPVTYFNSIGLGKDEIGTIKATVKELSEYGGEPQIVVQRAKLLGEKA